MTLAGQMPELDWRGGGGGGGVPLVIAPIIHTNLPEA